MRISVRKILSLVLTICVLISAIPLSVNAESGDLGISRPPLRSGTAFSIGESGTYVIAALVDGVYYAMSNSISGKISGSPIAVTNGCVTEDAAAGYAFTLTYSGGTYTIQNDTHYLTYASSTNLGAATSAYTWTIAEGLNGSWRITSTATPARGVVFRAKDYLQFGGYAVSNAKEGSGEYFDVELLPVAAETFTRVTSASQLTAGRYVLLVTPSQSGSPYGYYALTKTEDASYFALQMSGISLSTLPNSITASENVIWSFSGTSSSMEIGGNDGYYLYNDPSTPNKLEYSTSNSSWKLSYNSSKGAFTLKSTYYLSLRDDTTNVGSNNLPLTYCSANTTSGNAYFYLYKSNRGTVCTHSNTVTSTTAATCTTAGKQTVTCKDCGILISTTSLPATGHSYNYTSNGDGTHKVLCSKCDYSSVQSCTLSGGKCSLCNWTSGSASTGTFQLITAANQITDGNYVLMVAPGGTNPGSYPYYALTRQMHSTSYVMAEGLQLSSVPQSLSVSNELMVWTLSGDSSGFTLTGADGSVLYNASNNLYYGDGIATSWMATLSGGTFTLNADTRYLGLRDDLSTVDSNGNPCFRCNSSAKTSSYQFYLYKSGTLANPQCPHANTTSNLTPATCTQAGLLTIVCKDCGNTVSSETVEALGHNASYVEGVPAGCKTEGRIPHYVCTNCNLLFSDTFCNNELKPSAIIVAPIGHDVFAVGGLTATCGTEGMMAHYQCHGCGAYFLDEKATEEVALTDLTIPALGHDLIETPATPASCAREGNIAYYTCEECNAIFSDESCKTQIYLIDTVLPALNHSLSYSSVVEATCTASGVYAYYYCSICDIYYSDNDYTETITQDDLIIPPLGHDIQFTNRIEPACTESGMIAHYYCNRCHSLFSDAQGKNSLTQQQTLIPATGHSYSKTVTPATCTTAGSEEYTCTACGDFYSTPLAATGHAYENGICTSCGAGYATVDSSIVINHNLNLASDISINFAVRTDLLSNYDSYYLEVRVPIYQGNTLQSYRTVQIQPVLNGIYYYFTLTGITAVQIGDEVQAVLHMTKDGTESISNTDYYSVAKYAYAQLNKSTTKESLNRLCANLLQYGAAAQVYKSYRTNAYADAAMTTAHKAYLTDIETITFTNHNRTLNDLSNPTVLWQGKALILDSKITVKYVINTAAYSGSVDDLTLRVQYLDYSGESRTVTLDNIEKYGDTAGWYAFDFDGLLAAELRQVLSAAVYQGNTRVSQTLEYSVESYGCNRTGTLLALCKAMLAYSDTALAFFNS